MKKILSWTLVLMLFTIISSTPLYANSFYGMQERELYNIRFSHINVFQSTFDITDNGRAEISVYLNARNASKVKVKTNLQKYENGSWKTIKTWSNESNKDSVGIGKSYYVTKDSSYRIKSYGYVYDDSDMVEKTSSISNEINY